MSEFMEVTGFEILEDSVIVRLKHDEDEHVETIPMTKSAWDLKTGNQHDAAFQAVKMARRAGYEFCRKKYGEDSKHLYKFECLAMSQKEVDLMRAALNAPDPCNATK